MIASRCLPVAVVCSLWGAGCVVAAPPEDEPVAEATQELVWTNGDSPTTFWQPSIQAALRALAPVSLTGGGGVLARTGLTATAGGQNVLHYVVGCALPAGASVYSADAGMTFAGAVGLAPEWASGPLSSVASQRWVTGCLLQTLNGLGVHVPIRLSGSISALADQAGVDASGYTVPDATAFGNLFQLGARAFVCTDLTLLGPCGVNVSLYTLERICGLSLTCGLTLLGPCALSCAADPTGATCVDPWGNSYPQAVSTSLQSSLAISLLPACQL